MWYGIKKNPHLLVSLSYFHLVPNHDKFYCFIPLVIIVRDNSCTGCGKQLQGILMIFMDKLPIKIWTIFVMHRSIQTKRGVGQTLKWFYYSMENVSLTIFLISTSTSLWYEELQEWVYSKQEGLKQMFLRLESWTLKVWRLNTES